jgi:hypothetical protein
MDTAIAARADRVWTVRAGSVTWRVIDDETVLLDTTEALYLVLNHSASAMWSALGAGASVDHLAQVLVDAYSIDPQLAHDDALGFIDDCSRRGWID